MSKVLKSSTYQTSTNAKVIVKLEMKETPPHQVKSKEPHKEEHGADPDTNPSVFAKALVNADQIRLQAQGEVAALKAQAQTEIEEWWGKQRSKDQQVVEKAREEGYQAGTKQGYEDGLQNAQRESRQSLDQAKAILEQAVLEKHRIVDEAEPFLVELCTAVTKKIIGDLAELDQATVLSNVQSALQRTREKGAITVGVNPDHYAFVNDHRESLLPYVEAQADLVIVPDYHIQDEGAVIRTSMGSLDARIDTQLDIIRKALLQIAHERMECREPPVT